jgi:hypothetical protein
VSERHGKESASNAAPIWSMGRVLALFAALVVSLTLTAVASADVSFIKAYGWGVSDGASQFETCTSTCQRGEAGGGAGEFGDPDGVATDSSGDVYVADYGDARIDEFSAAGSFIKAYGWGVSDGASRFETCTSSCTSGLFGGGAGEFEGPIGVATDSSGDVYVADFYNNRIDEFSGSVAASTLAQGPPTSATVTDGAGYSGQLTVTNANGTVTYTETASADSSDGSWTLPELSAPRTRSPRAPTRWVAATRTP